MAKAIAKIVASENQWRTKKETFYAVWRWHNDGEWLFKAEFELMTDAEELVNNSDAPYQILEITLPAI